MSLRGVGDPAHDDVDAVVVDPVARLYALAPEEFIAARDAAAKNAKAAGHREAWATIAALRKPTLSAYAVNALARDHPRLLEQLCDLGQALAAAQRAGSGADLSALGAQRRELVEAVADQAVASAARPIADQIRREIVDTLEAAVAQPASAQAVRSGRLVRALSYAGLGDGDFGDAVAPTTTPLPASTPSPASKEKHRMTQQDAVAQAQERSQQAHGALDDAVRAHEQALQAATQAQTTEQAADEQAHAAQQALQSAQDQVHAAEERRREARIGLEQAANEVERTVLLVQAAQVEAEQARATLDELRRG